MELPAVERQTIRDDPSLKEECAQLMVGAAAEHFSAGVAAEVGVPPTFDPDGVDKATKLALEL